jgi:4-hydroxy-tetrahydrodipicolinate synthase
MDLGMTDSSEPRDPSPVNRRAFLGSSVTAFVALASANAALAQPNTKRAPRAEPEVVSAKKQWARDFLRGGESFILPSLMPDMRTPDEEGIRRDVRNSIDHGLVSILPITTGLNDTNARRMEAIIADEAKGKILMVGVIRPGTWDAMASHVRYMEALGTTHVLMYFNPELPSQDAMYEQMLSIIENTSLAIILYAKPTPKITHLDPTGLPLDAFEKLADHDSVVGVKFTQSLRPATAYAVAERVGRRLLLGVVDLELMLPLSLKYPMQWTGQWAIESLQSPDEPWVMEFLELLRRGKSKEAYDLYWRYESIASNFYALQLPSLSIGGHPWIHIKYMKWLTGGNGGLLPALHESPEFVPHLDARGRADCRAAFAKVGIKTVDLPDEAFIVGNAAYERGVRVKDLASLPQYIV